MSSHDDAPRTPGQLLRALLAERGWNQRVLAIVLGVQDPIVNRMVSDKRPIDAQMALMLSDVFGVQPERFLQIQGDYDLAMARIAAKPDPDRAMRAHLYGDLPIAEMISRGWISVEDMRDVRAVEAALTKFFGAERPAEIEILPHAARKTDVSGDATPAQLAWLYRVRSIATEMVVPRYSPAAVRAAITELADLRTSPHEVRRVPRILGDAGVRFVIVESLASAKIDGACFWLNDMAPVVGVTLRHDRIDNFWFVLRHELEHVLRGHGRRQAMVDVELEGDRAGVGADVAEEERQANEAAAEFCVPQDQLKRFIARKSPFFAERDILGFANTVQVHPGLVAGQLQRHTGRYDRFRSHLAKIRSAVTPGAAVDGWGNVFPVAS